MQKAGPREGLGTLLVPAEPSVSLCVDEEDVPAALNPCEQGHREPWLTLAYTINQEHQPDDSSPCSELLIHLADEAG